jgi:hypothetical protein
MDLDEKPPQIIPKILRELFDKIKRCREHARPLAPTTAAGQDEKVVDQEELLEELATVNTELQGWVQTTGPYTVKVKDDQLPVLGYIKNVSKKVDERTLLDTLQRYGELIYFDLARTMVKSNSMYS